MHLTGNVDAGNIILLVLISVIAYLNRREYMESLKKFKDRMEFVELWRVDHDKWASSRSEVLSQLHIGAQRLETLMEVMDKRVSRLEEHGWGVLAEKK
jgi:hypothetical protein